MEYLEARETLRKITRDITQHLPLLKEGKIQEFRQACEPMMEQINLLKDEFICIENFDLIWSKDCTGEDPFAYVVFFSLAEAKPREIFENDEDFMGMLSDSGIQGEELADESYNDETGFYDELPLEEIASFMQRMDEKEAKKKLYEVIVQITENLPILEHGDVKAFLDACLPAIYQIEELEDHFVSYYNYDLSVKNCEKEDPLAYVVYCSMSGRDSYEIFEDEEEFDEWVEETSDVGAAILNNGTAYSDLTLEQISEFMQSFPE